MDQSLNQETVDTHYLVIEPRLLLARAVVFVRAHRAALIAAALLAMMAGQMFAVIWRKSITIDEIVMIPSAYYHLAAGDFQLVFEHPPLSKIFAAAPLLLVQPHEARPDQITHPPGTFEAGWDRIEKFWQNNRDQFEALSFWPRVGMIFLTVGLGILIFRFARELFNDRVAVISVALFALEPTVLAHGRVVQTDVPAAFGYLLFFIALHYYNRQRTLKRAVLLGGATAVALLGKYSMLLVGLALAGFFLAAYWRAQRNERRRLLYHAASVFVAILIVINAAYFFQHHSMTNENSEWVRASFTTHPRRAQIAVQALTWLLPKEFVLGIFFQFGHNASGHFAGLLGRYSQEGWWYYFPVAFVLKTTLPFLILSLAAIGWGGYHVISRKESRFLWLIVPFALYTVFVLFSQIDIGVRYYLPAYPFLFILAAALLDRLWKSQRARRAGAVVAVAVVIWIGIEAIRIFPDHMSYLNQLASRAPHWWYLSDSNVEWGDDIRTLANYLRANGETRVTDGTLGGWFLLGYYGIERVDALAAPPPNPPRYIAVGASYLNGSTLPSIIRDGRELPDTERVNFFSAYRNRRPEAVFGGSIYLFRQDEY